MTKLPLEGESCLVCYRDDVPVRSRCGYNHPYCSECEKAVDLKGRCFYCQQRVGDEKIRILRRHEEEIIRRVEAELLRVEMGEFLWIEQRKREIKRDQNRLTLLLVFMTFYLAFFVSCATNRTMKEVIEKALYEMIEPMITCFTFIMDIGGQFMCRLTQTLSCVPC
jgi:hypothetical protein